MTWCIGCDSWTPASQLCDACGYHSGLVWALRDESYLEYMKIDSGRSETAYTVNGGDDEC